MQDIGVADISSVLDIVEMQGKRNLKGYTVYGKLSDYALMNIDADEEDPNNKFIEKMHGGGVFALFYPSFYVWKFGTNYLKRVLEQNDDWKNYKIFESLGSVLVYIPSEDWLGKDICIDLVKGTSLGRISGDDELTFIMNWVCYGQQDWKILPVNCRLLEKEDLTDLDNFISMKDNSVVYHHRELINAYKFPEWTRGTPISSTYTRIQTVKPALPSTYVKKNCKKRFNSSGFGRSFQEDYLAVRPLTKLCGQYVARIKKTSLDWLNHSGGSKKLDRLADNIISEYAKYMEEYWYDPVGNTGHKGKYFVQSILDEISELTIDGKNYQEEVDLLRCRIMEAEKAGSLNFCEPLTKQSENKIIVNKRFFAAMLIAKIAQIPMSRLASNYAMCKDAYNIPSTVWFLLFLNNPYLLTLLGGAIQYRDCVKISSAIRGKEIFTDPVMDRETTKELLYVLNIYRSYTKDSRYKDTLVSYGELLNKDVKVDRNLQDKIWIKEAGLIWKDRTGYETGVVTYDVPKLFDKDNTNQIIIHPYTYSEDLPYLNDTGALQVILDKLISLGLMFEKKGKYSPTYEANMELNFLKWIYNHKNCQDHLLSKGMITEIVDISSEELPFLQMAGYSTALLVTATEERKYSVLDKFIDVLQNISDKEIVFISNEYSFDKCGVSNIPKPPYIEPNFLCRRPPKQIEGSKTYIIDNVNKYCLWELYTIISNIDQKDKIFFVGDKFETQPSKGVDVFSVLYAKLPYVEIGLTEEDINSSEINLYKNILTTEEDGNRVQTATKRLITVSDVDMDQELSRIIKKIRGLEKSDARVINDKLSLMDIGIFSTHPTDYNYLLENKDPKNFLFQTVEGNFYLNDRVLYKGLTDLNKPHYSMDSDGNMLETDRKGITRNQEYILGSVLSWKDVKLAHKKNLNNLSAAVILIDECGDLILLDSKFYKGILEGEAAKVLKKGGVYSYAINPGIKKPVQILIMNSQDHITKEELYSAVSCATKRVYFVGSVSGSKSTFEISREITDNERGRTLCLSD